MLKISFNVHRNIFCYRVTLNVKRVASACGRSVRCLTLINISVNDYSIALLMYVCRNFLQNAISHDKCVCCSDTLNFR